MTCILAIECAGASLSVAFLKDAQPVAVQKVTLTLGYPEVLVPMIQQVLSEAHKDFDDIDIIAASAGAGSFTGVRIALATASGIALAKNKKAVGVSNFDACAFMVPEDKRKKYDFILAALETRRSDFYLQLFANDLKPVSQPVADTAEHFPLPEGKILLVGDAADRFLQAVQGKALNKVKTEAMQDCVPDAVTIGAWAFANRDNLPKAVPLYVSEAHVSVKL